MNILTIAGSDPTSGAGIQSDIKTFFMLHAYSFTVITSITSQNTKQFFKIKPISVDMVTSQLDSIFSDFVVDAVKIGVVYNSDIIKTIHAKLRNKNLLIVTDPILKSTTGGVLLQEDAFHDYKKLIIPISTVVTPNTFEASTLTGIKITSKKHLSECASKIKSLGAKNVVITGFEFKNIIMDLVADKSEYTIQTTKKSDIIHGTGCNYSAALVSYLAMGETLYKAACLSQKFVYDIIINPHNIGNGSKLPIFNKSNEIINLNNAILKLKQIDLFYTLIPECQTNFVFSKVNPKSINDVVGISGRIIKSKNKIIIAGGLEYGGSKHVATAVVEISKKFPEIRSAINIKYNKTILHKLAKMNYNIISYNRLKEPNKIKSMENKSISWGIKNSLRSTKETPDVIFHKGDIGKEPMILIFGKEPFDVIHKIYNLC